MPAYNGLPGGRAQAENINRGKTASSARAKNERQSAKLPGLGKF